MEVNELSSQGVGVIVGVMVFVGVVVGVDVTVGVTVLVREGVAEDVAEGVSVSSIKTAPNSFKFNNEQDVNIKRMTRKKKIRRFIFIKFQTNDK